MDITFHYPPELMNLLVDCIPKLCKSKKDLLAFFQGAGIGAGVLSPFERLLRVDKTSFQKYDVTRKVLIKLNSAGEKALRERREVLKRVVEFSDFTVCWETDQLPARGLVSQIRDMVHLKDSVTRITLDRDAERAKRMAAQEALTAERHKRSNEFEAVKKSLFALFGERDPHKRGKMLEGALNGLFRLDGIQISEPFTLAGASGEGIIEQIDGLISLDGHIYLVEMKWWKEPLGPGDVAQHIVRVHNRGGQARGLFLSHSDFTPAAVASCKESLAAGAVIVLAVLEEIVHLLEKQADLKEWLQAKVTNAIAKKDPYSRPME